MFGILIPGQLPLANFVRMNETQFIININDVAHVNHVVVYMTGEMPFPDGYAGAVHFNYTIDNETRWVYLGKLCNTKPSVIFRITNLKHDESPVSMASPFVPVQSQHIAAAVIGISVEPEAQIDALTPAADTQLANVDNLVEFCQKMLQNFYNYASSFAKDGPDGQQWLPFGTLQGWFENFKRRLDLNPNFWKTT